MMCHDCNFAPVYVGTDHPEVINLAALTRLARKSAIQWPGPMKDDATEILALEQERCQAEIDGDTATLERLLDDSFIYVHTSGAIDRKEALISSRKNVNFLKMTRQNLQVHVSGDLAVITGSILLEAQLVENSNFIIIDAFCTQVLARRAGKWKFIVYHSTRLKQ